MDVSDLLDEVKPQAPNGLNEFAEDFYKEETGKTIAAARWSRQYDPQSYAQAAKLMPEAPEVGIRQMELLKNYDAVSKFSKIFEDSPQLRGYFAEKPKDLAFANPDDLDNISGLQWLMQAGGAGVEAGYNQYRAADAANRLAEGRGSQADQEIIRKYDGNRTFGARGWFDSGFVGAAQQVVPLALTGLNTARRAFEGSVLFAGAGAAAGAGVGSVVPGPGTAAGAGVGAASGAIFGAQAGAIAGAWEFQQKFQTGMARLYFAQLKDENGQQLEPELQNLAALVTGTGGALLETASMGQFIKTIPGGEKLIGMITAKGMSEALKNQTVRVALTNFAKNLGTTAATEITTEMLQQTLQITAEAAAKANSDGNFEQKTLGEIGEEVFDAGVQAAQVMSILGPLAAGTRFGSDIVEISRSKRQQDELGKITAHLENNELLERNPEIAAKLIDAQTGDKKLYIPAAEALELYQSQGLDLYGPALPNWRNRVDEALRTGGDIETSIGEYVAYLGRNPKENPLAALVRTSPEAYNKAEMAPYEEALNDILSSQIGIATQVNPNAPIAPAMPKAVEQFPELEELKKQITSVGFAPKAVEAYSTMLGAFFNTMATRTGKSPSEFFNEFMLSVRRGDIRDMKEGDATSTYNQSGIIDFFRNLLAPQEKSAEASFFEGSKLVDKSGKPIKLYHGTPAEVGPDFAFDLNKVGSQNDSGFFGDGFYFTPGRDTAERYSGENFTGGGNLIEAGVNSKNPLVLDGINRNLTQSSIARLNELGIPLPNNLGSGGVKAKAFAQAVKNAGFDAIVMREYAGEEFHSDTLMDVLLDTPEYFAGLDNPPYIDENGVVIVPENNIQFPADIIPEGNDFYTEVVALDPTQVKSLKGNKTFDATDPRIFNQENRGSIQVGDEGAVITLLAGHDLSTLLHEAGHFFLEALNRVKNVSPELQADWAIVAKKLEIKDGKITREQHETFAKMAEAYFMEGKSPTPELRSAFEQFARWLKTLYRRISQLGGSVSPEIREVFDRMLATEQRIEELVTDTAYAPIFKSAEEMGVSPEDYIAYQRLVEDLREEATVSARERIVGQRERLAKGWRETIQKELRAQAEETLKTQAPYTHMETLKSGKISIDDQSFQKKFSTQSPVVRVGGNSVEFNESARRAFPAKAFKKRGGTDVEVVAELLGYPSADDMVYDFTQAEPIKEASQRMAEQEMALRYGDDFNNSEIMNLAVKQQMAADGRLILLGKELQALKQKAGRGGDLNELGPKQLAVQIARDTIYRKKVGELNETQINASVRRSAAMAEASMVKGKWAEAADWKRKQLLGQALANEVTKISKTVSKIRDKAARYTRTSPPSVHPSYMEQIRALVEQYEFTKVSDKKLARRASLREFMDGYTDANGNYVPGEKDAGAVFVEIPDRLLRDAGRVNYKELSVEDLIGLGDTLDNLEHLGRVKNKLKKGQEFREFNSEKQELITGIKKAPKKVRRTSENYNEKEKGLHRWGAEFMASNLKPEQIISFLDLGDIAGPAMEKIFQPIADAQNAQNTLLLEYNKKLQDVIEGMKPEYLNEPIYVRELGKKFLREEIYVIALNSGSASNFKKLMEGELLNEGEVTNILSHLTKEDWTRIQKMWKTLDGLWVKISALEKRLTGVAPPKIESRQIINEHGTWEGGYYPTVYDFKTQRGKNLIEDTTPADQVLDSQKFFDNKNVLPGTSHKHTVKRTKGGKAPIKLELGVLPSHIHTVIHDLTYREPVRDARKLLWDPDVKKAITDAQGPEAHTQLQHWLKSVATERSAENNWLNTAVRRIRTGTAIYAMGFRFMTAVAQGLGFFPALTKVSPRYIAHGIYTLAKHPIRSFEFVNGLSMEMRDRFNTQDRDINEISRAPTKSKLDKLNSYAFWMIGAMDKGVSTAIWIGAYNEFMTKRGDPKLAVMHADRAVRLSQGTGNIKDMAQVMNQGETSKLFTMFFSSFSAQYNMQADLTRKTIDVKNTGDYGKLLTEYLPQWIYLVVLPSIIGAFITGNGPDDDENEAMWATRKVLLYPFASVPFVRDVVGSVDSGFGYQFSPAARVLDTTSKTIGALFTTKDKDIGERLASAAKPAATAVSILLRYPTGQLINTVEGLWKGLENGDLEPQDLILGRRDK